MDYRCPKHDLVFESFTDQRKPGANATANLAAHPQDGHPDCPLCIEAAKAPKSQTVLAQEARARAAAAQERARAAQAAADAAAADAAQFTNVSGFAQTGARPIG
jgi:hypothetical protein